MVGRGGRDGAPSETLLLASPSDATAVRRFAVGDIPSPDDLRQRVPGDPRPRRHRRPGAAASRRPRPACSRRDARAGRDRAARLRRGPGDADRAARGRCRSRSGRRRPSRSLRTRGRRRGWSASSDFAESTECRHAQVAEHFGETFATPCGACDICDPPAGTCAPTRRRRRFRPTWPERSCAPSSASRGRSAGARSSRCCAARCRRRPRPAPRSPSACSRRRPTPR